MDYSQLSDQEINIQVARIMHPEREVIESKSRPPSACVIGHPPSKWLDYCNSPADAWPIIVDNKIKIEPTRRVRNYNEWYEEWDASVNSPHFCESHKNPLRAAMIVFLLSQDDNHA